MRPIDFPESNAIFGRDHMISRLSEGENGVVVSCWQLSEEEKAKVASTGVIWLHQLTFGERFNPHYASADSPFEEAP